METHRADTGMAQETASESKGETASPAYILAACVLWALVVYSLSPISKPQSTRPSGRVALVCDATAR